MKTNQTGFIKGRLIGENIRIICDIMNYTERNSMPGLLMMMDFEKVFDLILFIIHLTYSILVHLSKIGLKYFMII